MPLSPLIPDPALAEDEWLKRAREQMARGNRAVAELVEDMRKTRAALPKPDPELADYWLTALAKTVDDCQAPGATVTAEDQRLCDEYFARLRRSPLPAPKRRYPDTMQGALQADDDRRYELGEDEWEFGR